MVFKIEKEMLAVVFGLERFVQYTFGRKIFVTTDHKPLETIIRKPLGEAPRRLQRLIMRSNRYAFELTWAKGSSLLIADTLSRAAICNIASSEPGLTKETETKERSNIPDAMLEKLRAQTSEDDDMQVLIGIIKRGWPEEKSELPPSARPYFDFRNTMSIENGLIVRGEKVIVPKAMRGEIKRRLHAAHLSTDSMLRRARRTIFWPGIVAEIKQMADACETCQQSKPSKELQ
ncbi:hypothetical protein RRG08_062766 [Elysia crispata]|uniref:Integrase zinc-binding domain-containing protein n=1 Tax=Elysia crispata TaxID=231223 RepID=A0AAE0XVH7_9GAST|nr:hypothetical protein RRG08_062766 [Elysia crispata]